MAASLSLRASLASRCGVDEASKLSAKQNEAASRIFAGSVKAPPNASCSSSFSASARGSTRSLNVAAEPTSAETSSQAGTNYHFVIANAKFMLDEEEHFQEQLKERLRWLKEQGREQDFWLLYEPAFLDSFPEVTKRLQRPAVALVSTDSVWITFMRLRLDRVLMGEFECDSQTEALQAKPVDISFETPKNWVAPYTKYEAGWWKPYVPN